MLLRLRSFDNACIVRAPYEHNWPRPGDATGPLKNAQRRVVVADDRMDCDLLSCHEVELQWTVDVTDCCSGRCSPISRSSGWSRSSPARPCRSTPPLRTTPRPVVAGREA